MKISSFPPRTISRALPATAASNSAIILPFLHIHHHAFRRHPQSAAAIRFPNSSAPLPPSGKQACAARCNEPLDLSSPNNLEARNSKQRLIEFAATQGRANSGHHQSKQRRIEISSDTLCREKKQMPEPRAAHPYYLYDGQSTRSPPLIEKSSRRAERDAIERAADAMAEKETHHLRRHRPLHSMPAADRRAFGCGEFTARDAPGRTSSNSFEPRKPFRTGFRPAPTRSSSLPTLEPPTASVAALRAARVADAPSLLQSPARWASATIGAEIRSADFHFETCDQEVFLRLHKKATPQR